MLLINTPKNTQDRANKEYSENCRESSENCRFNNLENKFWFYLGNMTKIGKNW